jgi:hypothetical protein
MEGVDTDPGLLQLSSAITLDEFQSSSAVMCGVMWHTQCPRREERRRGWFAATDDMPCRDLQ